MKYTYHFLFGLLVAFLFIFISKTSFAQPRGMTMNQVNRIVDQRMRQANVGLRNNMWMGMGINTNWIFGAGKGTTYQVTFKDSSVKQVVSFMYTDTILNRNFIVFVDKKFPKTDTLHRNQKIYPEQTIYLSTISDYQANTEAYGVATDSCWTFKVINGTISVYAKSLNYLTLDEDQDTREFDSSAIVGIQLNDGPIVKFTSDNLKQMVGQDTGALESIEKKKYFRAIKRYNRHTDKG